MGDEKVWASHGNDWNKQFKSQISSIDSDKNLNLKWLLRVAKKSDSILDQGSGIGQYPLMAYKLGFKNVTGLDFSSKLIETARKNAKELEYPMRFVKGDIRAMPFKKNSFDTIISAGIVEHVQETEKTIEELARVIKKGGNLIIHVPHKISVFTVAKKLQQLLGIWNCGYEKSFTKKYFSKLLKENGFEIKEYYLSPLLSGKHKILGGILEVFDKPFYCIGLGGHHMCFLCKKI